MSSLLVSVWTQSTRDEDSSSESRIQVTSDSDLPLNSAAAVETTVVEKAPSVARSEFEILDRP